MIVNSFQNETVFQFCTVHGGSLKQQYRDIMLLILHTSFIYVFCWQIVGMFDASVLQMGLFKFKKIYSTP